MRQGSWVTLTCERARNLERGRRSPLEGQLVPPGDGSDSITARIVNQGAILSPAYRVSFRQGKADGTLLGEVDLPLLLKDGFADVNLV